MKKKIPYERGMGAEWARAYYGQQSKLRCWIIGHKGSGIIDCNLNCECLRCGRKWNFHEQEPHSIYSRLFLAPRWWVIKHIRRLLKYRPYE